MKIRSYCVALGVSLSWAGPGMAADIMWANPVSGAWNQVANWSPRQLPVAGDRVFITAEGTYTVTASGNVTVGAITVGGVTGTSMLVVNSGNFTVNGPGEVGPHGVLRLVGGTLAGAGDLTVGGRFEWQGGTINRSGNISITPAGTGAFLGTTKSFNGGVIYNDGLVDWTAGGLQTAATGSAGLICGPGGRVLTGGGLNWNVIGGGRAWFQNEGTLQCNPGFNSTRLGVVFTNLGEIVISSGELRFEAPGSFVQFSGVTRLNEGSIGAASTLSFVGGTLTGAGIVRAPVVSSAVIRPGRVSPGTLVIEGDFQQTANGMLEIELGGTSSTAFDVLKLTRTSSFAGTVRFSLVNGYVAAGNDAFRFIEATSPAGGFDVAELPPAPDRVGLVFDTAGANFYFLTPTPDIPYFAPTEIDEEVRFTRDLRATPQASPPIGAVRWSLVSVPSSAATATLDPVTGVFQWTPAETAGPGTYTFMVRATDVGIPAATSEASFTLKVLEVNRPPDTTPEPLVLSAIERYAFLQELVPDIVRNQDVPPGNLQFELVSGPAGLTVSSDGVVSWIPTEEQGPGDWAVEVRIRDYPEPQIGVTGFNEVLQRFHVLVTEENLPPRIDPIAIQSAVVGQIFQLQASASDPDVPANQRSFTLVSGPPGLACSAAGDVSWTPEAALAGSSATVVLRVTDDGNPPLSHEQSFVILVLPPPGPEDPVVFRSLGLMQRGEVGRGLVARVNPVTGELGYVYLDTSRTEASGGSYAMFATGRAPDNGTRIRPLEFPADRQGLDLAYTPGGSAIMAGAGILSHRLPGQPTPGVTVRGLAIRAQTGAGWVGTDLVPDHPQFPFVLRQEVVALALGPGGTIYVLACGALTENGPTAYHLFTMADAATVLTREELPVGAVHPLAGSVAMKCDAGGKLHVVVRTLSAEGQTELVYAGREPGGEWATSRLRVNPSAGDALALHHSLALGPDDSPAVAWRDIESSGVLMSRRVGNGWQTEAVAADGRRPSIYVDAEGGAHVAYFTVEQSERLEEGGVRYYQDVRQMHYARRGVTRWLNQTVGDPIQGTVERRELGSTDPRPAPEQPAVSLVVDTRSGAQIAMDTGSDAFDVVLLQAEPKLDPAGSLTERLGFSVQTIDAPGDERECENPSLALEELGSGGARAHLAYTVKARRGGTGLSYATHSGGETIRTEIVPADPSHSTIRRGQFPWLSPASIGSRVLKVPTISAYSAAGAAVELFWKEPAQTYWSEVSVPNLRGDGGDSGAVSPRAYVSGTADLQPAVFAFDLRSNHPRAIENDAFGLWAAPKEAVESNPAVTPGFVAATLEFNGGHYFLYRSGYPVGQLRVAVWSTYEKAWTGDELIYDEARGQGRILPGIAIDFDPTYRQPVVVFGLAAPNGSQGASIARRRALPEGGAAWQVEDLPDLRVPAGHFVGELALEIGTRDIFLMALVDEQPVLYRSQRLYEEVGDTLPKVLRETTPCWCGAGVALGEKPHHITLGSSAGTLHFAYVNPRGELRLATFSTGYWNGPTYIPTTPCQDFGYCPDPYGCDPPEGRAVYLPHVPGDGPAALRAAAAPVDAGITSAPGDLDGLRRLRDRMMQSSEGFRLLQLYYQHARETAVLGLSDPAVLKDAADVLRNFLPGFIGFAQGDGSDFVISATMIEQVNRVWDQLAARGSAALRDAIRAEQARHGGLRNFIGKSFAEWGEAMGFNEPFIAIVRTERLGGGVRLTVNHLEGRSYTLLRSPTLEPPAWTPVADVAEEISGYVRLLTDPTPGHSQVFYRVVADP